MTRPKKKLNLALVSLLFLAIVLFTAASKFGFVMMKDYLTGRDAAQGVQAAPRK